MSHVVVVRPRLVQYRAMKPAVGARAHSAVLVRSACDAFAAARQTRAHTREIRARARSTRQISMWLRDLIDENLVWTRVRAAERAGTAVIAGGADGDGHARARGRVVLVVDDHADTREMYAEFLTMMGFAPCEATTCAEALARCRDGGIDAVVLDRRLPDGDGMDVCRTLRAETGTRDLPIVVLSGWRQDDAGGADRYLMKPVIPDVLCRELESLLASRPAARASEPR
jgi:CheY-like chemotaxis protein